MSTSLSARLTLALSLMLSSIMAHAVIINPGDASALSGTTFADNPDLGGVVQTDNLEPFVLNNGFIDFMSGNVQARVVESNNTGELIFAPRIRDVISLFSSLEFSVITGLEYSGFGNVTTDVDFRIDGLGDEGASSVARSVDGDTLSFAFDSYIDLNEESLFLSILTDATEYDNTGSITIFGQDTLGGTTVSVTLNNMPAPVPVPTSAWLFASGLAATAWQRRRKG